MRRNKTMSFVLDNDKGITTDIYQTKYGFMIG